jgi:hypothetical protein
VLPIGQAHIQREGTDITIVTYSNAVNHSMEAAEELANEHGIQAEVGDWMGTEFLHFLFLTLAGPEPIRSSSVDCHKKLVERKNLFDPSWDRTNIPYHGRFFLGIHKKLGNIPIYCWGLNPIRDYHL